MVKVQLFFKLLSAKRHHFKVFSISLFLCKIPISKFMRVDLEIVKRYEFIKLS